MAWSELFERARRRYGVVGVNDAVGVGLTVRSLHRRASAEGWTPLHPGVWLVPGVQPTPMARTAAAVLAAGPGVATGRSSLWLHRALDTPPVVPELLLPYGTRGPSAGQDIRTSRTRWLPDEHTSRRHGIRAVIPERAIFELSARPTRELPDRRLRDLVIDAHRRRKLSLSTLWTMCEDGLAGRRGIPRLLRVLAHPALAGADSGWEVEVRDAVVELGLTVHPGTFPYRCPDGRLVHLDVALPGHWVCVECDGRAFHSGRRPFATDRVRWTQITREWQVVWVTYDRWQDDRAGVLADIRDVVEAADLSRPPARPAR